MLKRIVFLIFMLIALLLAGGCTNIIIETDVDFPAKMFKKAHAEIKSIHRADPHRKGSVSQVNILVYDSDDRQLIKFSVKKSFAEKFIKDEESSSDDIKKYSKKYGKEIDVDKFKDLDKIGPGLLMSIDSNEDKTHVLVWLE